MKKDQYEEFLEEIVDQILVSANRTIERSGVFSDRSDSFRSGQRMGCFEIITLMQNQAELFNVELSNLKNADPWIYLL